MSSTELLPRVCERVILRRLVPDDLRRFQAYRHDPVVGQFQGWTATSDDEALAFLTEMSAAPGFVRGEWFQLGIAERATGALIGDIGVYLSPDKSEATIGFSLDRSFQGRGLASESIRAMIALVFATCSVQRIIAITDERNLAAQNLLTAVGMRHTKTDEAVYHGESCIEYTFTLPR